MSFPRLADVLTVASSRNGTSPNVDVRPSTQEPPGREAARLREISAEERARVTERLQELARAAGRELEFRVDEASDRVVISVRDQRTGELIWQIPDEAALRIAQRLESELDEVRSVLFEDKA
ncbi:MAG: flagellar protein FlaG [Gammaproteobacteria bacterium]